MENNENMQPQEEEASSLPPKITKENINAYADSKQAITLQWIRSIIGTIIASFLISLSVHTLIKPNNFTVGGIAGTAILLEKALSIPTNIGTFCLNAPLIILSFFYVKKKFAILSTISCLLQTLWLTIFQEVTPGFVIAFEGSADKIFAAIAAGLCFGTAIVLALKVGGSTGGGDILAVLIQKKMGSGSIAWILFAINSVVIGASFFVFYKAEQSLALNLLPIMLSIFETYVESKANEALTNGFQSAVEFKIITDKPEEMATVVMRELSRGVTSLPAKGMYTKVEHSMIVCVVSRRQVAILKRVMRAVDPDAFAVMTNVSQVFGLGFYSSETNP